MNVRVAWATPAVQDVVEVELDAGATVADAVARSGLIEHHGLDANALRFAVFGRRTAGNVLVADGDRVEITRPLVADPKETRRRRALANSLSRPGAKAPPRTAR